MATVPAKPTELVTCSHSMSRQRVCDSCGGFFHLCAEAHCEYYQIACAWVGGCHPKCPAWELYRPFEEKILCCHDFPAIPCPRRQSPKSELVSDAVPDAY